jgi:cardiolipin synthase
MTLSADLLPSLPLVDPSAPFAEVDIGVNRIALLRDGGQAFPAMLQAIAAARSTICFETYIYREDATGQRFAAALCERARAGVEVSLMVDDWGSTLSADFVHRLRVAGVRTLQFSPVLNWRVFGRLFARLRRRNHRKALIVDGEVAFTGGLNVSDDYAAAVDGGRGWRDTHVRIKGPAAADLERMFLETWRKSRGARVTPERYQRPTPAPDPRVRIVGNEFRKDRKDIRKAYVKAIQGAKRRVHLTHAYFLPPSRVLHALQRAAHRGVEVSVILAATTDVYVVRLAAQGIYLRLLRSGVKVYEWSGRVLHAKTAVVDGSWSTVGSANLDALSLRANLEVNAVFEDEKLGTAVEAMFAQDLALCEEVTLAEWRKRSWTERILPWLAFQLRNWL